MREVDQDLDALLDDLVGAATFQVRNKPDAARVALAGWIVQPLRGR